MRFKEGEDGDKWLDDDRAASLTPSGSSQVSQLQLTQPPPRALFSPKKKS